jgi:hypothetical protein
MNIRIIRHVFLILVATLLVAASGFTSPASPARAAAFNPVTVTDLINAINTANANNANDVIDLGGNTFTITTVDNGSNGLPVILADGGHMLTIQNGSILREVSAPAFRILQVTSGATLTLTNVTVRYGSAYEGGGIYNSGTLYLNKSSILNNGASNAGGGIRNDFGTVTITDSLLDGNNSLTGGGISNSGGLAIDRSVFSNNTASNGGGIANNTNLGVTITNSTFYNNSSTFGGAIEHNATTILIINNSTFSNNNAIWYGGGILIDYAGVLLKNTILADSGGGNCYGNGFSADSYNIDTDGSCDNATILTSGQINLQPLASNGGFTQSMALGTGSLAIDTGDNNVCTPGPVNNLDQRGYLRINGANTICDVGAYEVGGVPPIPTTNVNPTALDFGNQLVGATSAAQTVTVTNTGSVNLNVGALSPSGQFALTADNCSNATVAPGNSCTFGVTFTPLSLGPKTGTVTIPSNSASNPDSVALSGNGVSIPAGTNLLINPTFDQTSQYPRAWSYSVPRTTFASLLDCTYAISPDCSLKIPGTKTTGIVTQTVNFNGAAGQSFTFGLSSAANIVPAGGLYKVEASLFNRFNRVMYTQILTFADGSHDWQTLNDTFTAPSAFTKIRYRFYFQKTSGWAWFDDAFLIQQP